MWWPASTDLLLCGNGLQQASNKQELEHQPKQAESHLMLGETAALTLTEMKLRKSKGEYGCVEIEGVRFDTDAALVM
jgi:hypothetical protein